MFWILLSWVFSVNVSIILAQFDSFIFQYWQYKTNQPKIWFLHKNKNGINFITKTNSTDVCFIWSHIDLRYNFDHEIDDVHPVVFWADVSVTNATGVIDDETNIQVTF